MNPEDLLRVAYPHPGMESWTNQHGITVLRLHYSADEEKGGGEKTYVPEINKFLSPWALKAYHAMTDPNEYLKEYEIDAEAVLGTLLFRLLESITVEQSFPIPENWTRRMALDPHPGIPHAFLWVATDPWGDRWIFREYWPSSVCYRWEDGKLLGSAGPCRQDERGPRIKEYVEIVKFFESDENRENVNAEGKYFNERIYERVIDYAARAFGKGSNDDPEQENYQQRYQQHLEEMGLSTPYFSDAKKDRQVGIELVNEGLRPIEVMGNDGEYHSRTRIHIFGDRCPELIHQLKHNRRQLLTPLQVERQDPTGKPVKVRNHMTDCVAAGTLISTEVGDIPIEDIKRGMKVLTRQGPKPVTDAWTVGERDVCRVELSNGATLTATPDHRIWTEHGWKPLDGVLAGESLEYEGPEGTLVMAKGQPSQAGTCTVHDLTVADANEFYANGILVHNCLRYLEMSNPVYIQKENLVQTWHPIHVGIAY